MTTEQWIVPASRGELVITRATPADVDALTAIYEETERWQIARGIDPGLPPMPLRLIVARRVEHGGIYLARVGGAPAGTVTLAWDDRIVWPDAPEGDAGYVHGLAVARAFAGRQIGLAILRWVEGYVAGLGKPFVRLDCNGDNPALRAYYVRAGYTHRGDVAVGRLASRYEKRVG
jgi:ribosomal protein S18 acetylase RimI-like enzyme